MQVYLAIAIGGVFGCWARFAMTNFVQNLLGRDFPYATLSVNVAACCLMGFLFVVTIDRLTLGPVWRTGVLTGFIGGFSTFSTFAMETYLLAEQGEPLTGLVYVVLSVVLGLLATFGGAYAARSL
jgi:fluoride exporter